MNRYLRQEILDFIPENFSEKVKGKKIVLIGCGGVGSVFAELLVRGGFLNLVLIDFDKVEITNLNRQIYFENDLGKFKAESLKKHLLEIDKNVNIDVILEEIDEVNIGDFSKDSDLIIDASDNFKIRNLINDYCVQNGKDWLYNGAVRTEVVSCLFYGKNNLFDKVFSSGVVEQKARDVGILPSTTFLAASLGFNQVMKYFLDNRENKLVKINLWTNKVFEVKIK